MNTPVGASWLNQIEVYFSVVQRRVLMPNECADLGSLEHRLLDCQQYYERIAQPLKWQFTRADLGSILAKAAEHDRQQQKLAA